jgi:hypothetical protein
MKFDLPHHHGMDAQYAEYKASSLKSSYNLPKGQGDRFAIPVILIKLSVLLTITLSLHFLGGRRTCPLVPIRVNENRSH